MIIWFRSISSFFFFQLRKENLFTLIHVPVYGKPQKEIASRRARNRWKKKEKRRNEISRHGAIVQQPFFCSSTKTVFCSLPEKFIGIRPLQACFLKTFLTSLDARDGGFVMEQIEINCQLETKLPMWKLRLVVDSSSFKSNFVVTEAISYARSHEWGYIHALKSMRGLHFIWNSFIDEQ